MNCGICHFFFGCLCFPGFLGLCVPLLASLSASMVLLRIRASLHPVSPTTFSFFSHILRIGRFIGCGVAVPVGDVPENGVTVLCCVCKQSVRVLRKRRHRRHGHVSTQSATGSVTRKSDPSCSRYRHEPKKRDESCGTFFLSDERVSFHILLARTMPARSQFASAKLRTTESS